MAMLCGVIIFCDYICVEKIDALLFFNCFFNFKKSFYQRNSDRKVRHEGKIFVGNPSLRRICR